MPISSRRARAHRNRRALSGFDPGCFFPMTYEDYAPEILALETCERIAEARVFPLSSLDLTAG